MLKRLRAVPRFLRNNGLYVLLKTLAEQPWHMLRNRMLAAKFGVRTISVGRHAHLRGLAAMNMGEDFAAGDGLWLEAILHYEGRDYSPKLNLGSHVQVSHWSHIACAHAITIGDSVLIGSKVIIIDHNHGSFHVPVTSPMIPPALRTLEQNGPVSIGSNVWLGDGVVVCPGVSIGEGSVIGANAVVTTDIPAFVIAVGVPARVVRRYDPSLEEWVRV